MEQLQEYAFIQAGMIVATIAFFWMGLSFPIGAKKGSSTGMRVLRSGVWLLLGGVTLVMLWAVVSGQIDRFSSALGLLELAEMAAFVAMFEFIVYFMADRYLQDKAAEEAADADSVKEVETTDA